MAAAMTINNYNQVLLFHYDDDDNCMCPGFYFEPKDDQIIGCFLTYIAKGIKLPALALEHIRFVDIYGDQPPWKIFCNDIPTTKVFHVITPLKYLLSQKRIKRTAGGGTWKGQSKREKIKMIDGEVVGEKYTLSFMMEKKSTHWNMTEYYCLLDYCSELTTINNNNNNNNNRTDQKVFCRIVYSGKQSTTTMASIMLVPVCGGKRRIIDDDMINNSITNNNDAIDHLPSQLARTGSEDQEDSAAVLADQEDIINDDYFLNEINFYNQQHVDDYLIHFITDCDIDVDIADNSHDEEPSHCPTNTTIAAAAAILASDDQAIITGSEEELDAFVSYLETQLDEEPLPPPAAADDFVVR